VKLTLRFLAAQLKFGGIDSMLVAVFEYAGRFPLQAIFPQCQPAQT